MPVTKIAPPQNVKEPSVTTPDILSKDFEVAVSVGSGPTPENPYNSKRVIGIDPTCEAAEGHEVVSCWIGFEPIPLEDNTADIVTAFDFLEHLPRAIWKDGTLINPFINAMSEIWRILKPGGLFYAKTPAFPHPVAWRDPQHVNIITDTTLGYFAEFPNPNVVPRGLEMGQRYGFKGKFQYVDQSWDGTYLVWKITAIKNEEQKE